MKARVLHSVHRHLLFHRKSTAEELRITSISFKLRDVHQVSIIALRPYARKWLGKVHQFKPGLAMRVCVIRSS